MSFLSKIFSLILVLACLLTGVASAKDSAKKSAAKKTDSKKAAPAKGKGKAE